MEDHEATAQADESAVVDPSLDEDNELTAHVRYTIATYGADYPVDGLVKRIAKGDIYVPDFQRGFVWSIAQASRFVESMLLGLPVPGIFLFKEPDTNKLVVVDGQQRLRTLQYFYEGILRGREFCLRGVSNGLDTLTYRRLSDDDRRSLDDAILHATIFQQDDPKGDRSSIYLVFERLNTGGTPLNPQEIRSCVYRGAFNDLLKELAKNAHWARIFGDPSRRAKDQELILRFLALKERADAYERPMKGFLNRFMDENRQAAEGTLARYRDLFETTAKIAAEHLGPKAFRPERNLNAAATDALLIGLAQRIQKGPIRQPERLASAADKLIADTHFLQSINSGTTDTSSIHTRIRMATEAFGRIA